jgi:hypothetical protein
VGGTGCSTGTGQAILEVTEKLDAPIEVVDKQIKRNGH